MEIVGFDTHILIWGVQKTSRQGQQEMIHKTARFLKHLDAHQTKVIIQFIFVHLKSSSQLYQEGVGHIQLDCTSLKFKFIKYLQSGVQGAPCRSV